MSSEVEIVMTSGVRVGTRIPVREDFLIGRDAGADLCLDEDPRVSHAHARIAVRDGSAVTIEDLGSGNGTFVNGARVSGLHPLADGDVIVVGTTALAIAVAAPPVPIDTVAETAPRIRNVATLDWGGNVLTLRGGDEIVIGRDAACDLVIPSVEASRHHARISYADGRWMLTDLGSMNGTHVNEERLEGESRWLAAGDIVTIGGEELIFDEVTLRL